jgi:hypothetical protein
MNASPLSTRLAAGLTGLLLAGGALAVPAAAHADAGSSTEHAQFTSDAEGWTPSATYTGLCLPQVLCPTLTATYAASGGVGGDADGYLSTTFSSLLSTVAGTTTGGWLSPAFTYTGVGGQQPTSVTLDLARKVDLSGLLGLDVLNDSHYQVDLVDTATGGAVTVVPSTPLTGSAGWAAIPPAQVSPDRLTIGDSYQVRITTTYHSVATVVAAGEVGYDDLRLTASRVENSDTHTDTTTIVYLPAPTPTPAPADTMSTRILRQYVKKQGLPATAKLVGNHVKLTVSCLAAAAPRSCKYAVQGLARGKGSPASTGRKVLSVQAGAHRTISLKVRPAYLAKYKKAKQISVRAKVRVGVYKVTVVKKVRLKH